MRHKPFIALLGTLLLSGPVFAHGDAHHAPRSGPVIKEQMPWGVAGEAKDAARTLEVTMTDDMRFTPGNVEVEAGATLRIVVHNAGSMMHELVIGDEPSLAEHAELMEKFPNMEHDEPYMAHVPPGETREITWTFNRSGTFQFACLLPGHYQAGMMAQVEVRETGKHAAARPDHNH